MTEQSQHALHNACRRFANGDEIHAYSFMGCHAEEREGMKGFVFRVWAPNARCVSIVGDWNAWEPETLRPMEYGVWEAFCEHACVGDAYRYSICTPDGTLLQKVDPYAFEGDASYSRVAVLGEYEWQDEMYRRQQGKRKLLDAPMHTYEVNLAVWRQAGNNSFALAARELVPYIKSMGYTHLSLVGLAGHAKGSLLPTSPYAPDACSGTPELLMELVDACHQEGIGVLLVWEPSHFTKAEGGLACFDGGFCYESSDPLMREFPHWGTRAFDLARGEVQSFLISNAVFWMEQYHMDGICVRAVSSMLYLDYGRNEFQPNPYGGRENPDGIAFLRKLNRAVFSVRRNAITCAEEETSFPMVTKPDYDGGLGFLYKYNHGWWQSMRSYMQLDPLWRKGSHALLTEPMRYAYAENFVLTVSGAGFGELPPMAIFPGSYEDKFSNLRLLYAYAMAHPGKKRSVMGSELAPFDVCDGETPPNWELLTYDRHRQARDFIRDFNLFYLKNSTFWNSDTEPDGFAWLSVDDCDNSVVALRRLDRRGRELIAIFNFCPVKREKYRLGLPRSGEYEPVLNSDDVNYGGCGTKISAVSTEKIPLHGQPYSAEFTLAPLSAAFYKRKVTPRNY